MLELGLSAWNIHTVLSNYGGEGCRNEAEGSVWWPGVWSLPQLGRRQLGGKPLACVDAAWWLVAQNATHKDPSTYVASLWTAETVCWVEGFGKVEKYMVAWIAAQKAGLSTTARRIVTGCLCLYGTKKKAPCVQVGGDSCLSTLSIFPRESGSGRRSGIYI